MIPVWMKIKVVPEEGKKITIPLPLFLVWIVVFALLIVVFPLVLVAGILTYPFGLSKKIFCSYFMIYALIFSLSGLKVDVDSKEKNKTVYINII